MVDVQTDILITAPLDKVVAYASDPDNAPHWYVNIKSVEWITEKPLQVGSRMAFITHFMGKKLSYTYEVTALTKDKMTMRTAEGPFPMETQYTWEQIDSKTTRMFLRNRGNPKGFSKVMSPIVALMMRKANQKDLKCIKHILEKYGG